MENSDNWMTYNIGYRPLTSPYLKQGNNYMLTLKPIGYMNNFQEPSKQVRKVLLTDAPLLQAL